MWGLAALGFLRLWRRGQRAYTLGLLGIAPFGLLPLQPYGGELLLRIFLFSLPFMAFLAAAAFFPAPNRVPRWFVPGAATVVCVGLLGAFMVARYGNERMDAFTQREITAMDRLYAVAPPESVIMAAGSNTAWKYIHYKDYKYKSLTSEPGWKRVDALRAPLPVLATAVADQMAVDAGKHKRAYFIITKRQEAGADLLGLAPRGSLHRVGRALRASPRLRLLYANRDARVYQLRRSAKGTPRS
jgi:hypothetical protein